MVGHSGRSVWLFEDDAAESERVVEGTQVREYPPMGTDTDTAYEHLSGDTVGGGPVAHRFQSCLVLLVVLGIRAKDVDQDDDVAQGQPRPSIRSRRPTLSFKSTRGKMPPPALHSESDTHSHRERLRGRRNASESPCSMSAVSVMPRRVASCQARSMRASSRRTVVLICHNLLVVSHYAKYPSGSVGSGSRRSTQATA